MAKITAELKTLLENDPFPHWLGFRLLDLEEGYARIAVTTRPEHANFLGTVDGGVIAALSDYAGACAANTLGPARVGIQLSINFVANAPLNSELYAEARAVHAGKAMAIIEITVTTDRGKLIAKATGAGLAKTTKD